jgi:hypothetical protein
LPAPDRLCSLATARNKRRSSQLCAMPHLHLAPKLIQPPPGHHAPRSHPQSTHIAKMQNHFAKLPLSLTFLQD